MASDHSGEKPSSIGAVAIRQTSKPRNTLVISPGGNAPDGVEIIGALKSGPLACTQRIARQQPGRRGGDRHQQRFVHGARDRAVTEPR